MLRHQRIDILLSTIIGKAAQMLIRLPEGLAVKIPMEHDIRSPLLEFRTRTKTSQSENGDLRFSFLRIIDCFISILIRIGLKQLVPLEYWKISCRT